MKGALQHPFSGAYYLCTPEGQVRVEAGGKTGLFQRDGQWIEGELREADPQFCGWVAGDRYARRGLRG